MVRESKTTYRDVLRVLARHKKKVFAFFFATLTVALAVALFWPKTFQSQVKLFVKVGRESVTLDPTATTGDTVQLQASRESEINSVMEMLHGRALSERVVERLGVDTVLAVPPQNAWFDRTNRTLQKWKREVRDFAKSQLQSPTSQVDRDNQIAADEREAAIKLLSANVAVHAPKNSSVITLTAKAQTPESAQKFATDWIDAYFDEHIQANRTPGSLKLFEQQTNDVEQELIVAKKELAELKNRHEMVSADSQLVLLEKQKQEIEEEQMRVARKIEASEGALARLQQALKDIDQVVLLEREEGHSNEASDLMRDQLYGEQIEERSLRETYSNEHPLVLRKQQQIAALKKLLEEENGARTHSKFAANPNWQQLQMNMLSESVELADLKGTAAKLSEQRQQVGPAIQDLNLYALQIEMLERRVAILEGSYRNYATQLNQARISDAIERQRISNVNIIQAATLEPEPTRPKAMLVLPVGLFFAIAGAMGLAFVCEYLDPKLYRTEDIEQAAGVPVLVAIPKLPQSQLRVREPSTVRVPARASSTAAT